MTLSGCLLHGTALAQTPPEHIPEGHRCVSAGETFQCFDLEDYKQVLKADIRHGKCLERNEALEQKDQNARIQIFNLKKAVEIQEMRTEQVINDNRRIYQMWLEENKKRHEAENQPQYGSWLLWAATGTFAVTTAVLAGMAITND